MKKIKSSIKTIFRYFFPKVYYENGLKIEVKSKIINIIKGDKCVRISKAHQHYLADVIRLFDFYFNSVKPIICSKLQVVDFSYSHTHELPGYDLHKVMFPSFAEPITTTKQYLDFAELNENSIVIDLGAYSGLTSILFDMAISKNNSRACGKVIAVDPDSKNINSIEFNFLEYKKATARHIEFLHAATMGEDGFVDFSCEGNMGASTVDIVGGNRGEVEKVPAISLISIAKKYNLEKVDFIKCDIEGGEIEVFKDTNFFKKFSPRIIIETHFLYGYTQQTTPTTIKLLNKYGYTCKEIKQDGFDLPLLECVREK